MSTWATHCHSPGPADQNGALLLSQLAPTEVGEVVWAVASRASGAECRALGATDRRSSPLTMAWVAAKTAGGLLVAGFGGLPSMWFRGVVACGLFGWCVLSPIATGQGVLLVCAVIEGACRGGCRDGDHGPLACGPHLNEADRLLYRHGLIGFLEEIYGSASPMVGHPLLSLVVYHIATRALFGKHAYLRLATESGCK